ncbi:uncharacterized protein LOC112341218 [Selaginella moellendorffii]|uniref:uncharacterized protein LOC112341218 n=1 Tax=Selaginella moellendorffii TaxID=88036 RepID=UPI000D1CF0B0|nr:uncharacterized protein LOC112341218 [Selaginella moellendorffii]|eukprot:XP_024516775.1 uncharacterized protein LOC112341218 [Selaginella moellendorffii]
MATTLRLFGKNIVVRPSPPPPLSPPPTTISPAPPPLPTSPPRPPPTTISPPPPPPKADAIERKDTAERKHWHRFGDTAEVDRKPRSRDREDDRQRSDRENHHHHRKGSERNNLQQQRDDRDGDSRHRQESLHPRQDRRPERPHYPQERKEGEKGGKIDEELWHYTSSTGKTQGPYSIHLLKKWRSMDILTGAIRVWRRGAAPATDSIDLAALIDYYDEAGNAGIQTWMYEDAKGALQGPRSLDELRSRIARLPEELKIWKIGQSQERVLFRDLAKIGDDRGSKSPQRRRSREEEEGEEAARKRARREREDNRHHHHHHRDRDREREWRPPGVACRFYDKGYCRNGAKCAFLHLSLR